MSTQRSFDKDFILFFIIYLIYLINLFYFFFFFWYSLPDLRCTFLVVINVRWKKKSNKKHHLSFYKVSLVYIWLKIVISVIPFLLNSLEKHKVRTHLLNNNLQKEEQKKKKTTPFRIFLVLKRLKFIQIFTQHQEQKIVFRLFFLTKRVCLLP